MEQFEDCPVIAAVKDEEGLRACLDSEIRIVFVLYGDICSISGIVGRLKDAGKTVIVHLDLISGLSGKEIAVSFIHSTTAADGIISTKPALIRQAKELGMFTVMRFFAIDSMAFENIRRQSESVHPDFIEVLPGLMPKVIRRICAEGRIDVYKRQIIVCMTVKNHYSTSYRFYHYFFQFSGIISNSSAFGRTVTASAHYKSPSARGGYLLPPRFLTVCAVNSQTCLNGYNNNILYSILKAGEKIS